MGNSFVFPAPKCTYTADSLFPFYLEVPGAVQRPTSPGFKKEPDHIPALYIKSRVKSKYLFVYTHGNSEDLGRLYCQLVDYYERFQIDIIAPEFPGYGIYKGKTTSDNMIKCVEQTIAYATSPTGLGYDLKNTIIIGRSIGTGLAVDMAAKLTDIKGLILISAFLSIREIAQSYAGMVSKYFVSDIFKNDSLIQKIECPTLFIHGKKDEVIPFWHSTGLYYRAKCAKQISLSEDMTHNRSKTERDIYKPMQDFLFGFLGLSDLSMFEESKIEDLAAETSATIIKQCAFPLKCKYQQLTQSTLQLPKENKFFSQESPDMADKSKEFELTQAPILLKAKSTNAFVSQFQMRIAPDTAESRDRRDLKEDIKPEVVFENSE